MPQSGEILPNQQGQEGQTNITPRSGEISPKRREENNPHFVTENRDEIPPKEPDEVTDLKAMEEGARAQTPDMKTYSDSKNGNGSQGEEDSRKDLPQIDTAQHFLDDNFSDVMRSSVLGSNVSSLFNTTTFDTTESDQKVTLDWILPDGKNSQLETTRDKHITDFPALGGNTGAMLVHLPDLIPFYTTNEFLIDLQSGELFVKLKDRRYPAGLTCKKRNFEVVYNYYINDGREGWKQVEKSEIPPNVLNDKIGVESAENLPSRLGNDTHRYSGEISLGKPGHNVFNAPSGKAEEARHPDKKRINVTEAKPQSQRSFMNRKWKCRICHHHQHTIPITHHQIDIRDIRRQQQC